jgi:hypothetical protein
LRPLAANSHLFFTRPEIKPMSPTNVHSDLLMINVMNVINVITAIFPEVTVINATKTSCDTVISSGMVERTG